MIFQRHTHLFCDIKMFAHKLLVGIHLSVEISFILIVLFSVETNDEQDTVDMSLKDLAEAGKIGFSYIYILWFFFFLSVQEKTSNFNGIKPEILYRRDLKRRFQSTVGKKHF